MALATGTVARQVLRALGLRLKNYVLGHGRNKHVPPNGLMLYDSYHCDRYNTQTTRLNEAMFHVVFSAITGYLNSLDPERIRS